MSNALFFLFGIFQTSQTAGGITGWVVILIFAIITILIAWLIIRNTRHSPEVKLVHEAGEPPAAADDLAIIEGIGPKIASLFQEAGITTFAQLAATDPSRLRQILLDAGLRLGDPATWPEQARLAAAGDWQGLEALQSRLKGGRNV